MKFQAEAALAYEEDFDSIDEFSVEPRELDAKEEAEIAELILTHRENGRKLARSILRRWRVRMPADEIDSIVDLALCEAARRYSSERGASFMTFYFYHLRGHLVRSVARAAQASNLFLAFTQHNGVDTTDWQHLSSDAMWSLVPDQMLFGQRDVETPEHVVLRKEKISECRDAVTKLDELEKEIINRSFSSEEPLVDIARALGYSRCHISRVKKTALERLKLLINNGGTVKEIKEALQQKPVEETLVDRIVVSGRGRPKRRSRRRTVNPRVRISVAARSRVA